jgi:SAM-dependent methyltransferase
MAEDRLTTRDYWIEYWRAQTIDREVDERYRFHELLKQIVVTRRVQTSLELGGYPGYRSIWLHKYHGVEADVLDYVIDRPTIERLQAMNGVAAGAIRAIEADLFGYNSPKKYDLVFSNGLIEHFADMSGIIGQHFRHLADDGTLLITVPNFLGFNGVLQRVFDPDNLSRHNLRAMEPSNLIRTCEGLGLTVERVGYHERFGIWLESLHKRTYGTRALLWSLNKSGKLVEIFPRETRWFSPYLFLTARRHAARDADDGR